MTHTYLVTVSGHKNRARVESARELTESEIESIVNLLILAPTILMFPEPNPEYKEAAK